MHVHCQKLGRRPAIDKLYCCRYGRMIVNCAGQVYCGGTQISRAYAARQLLAWRKA